MADLDRSFRILFSAPAYWPALAFGGPIWMARELNEEMVRRGHYVDVLTTSLMDVRSGRSRRTVRERYRGRGRSVSRHARSLSVDGSHTSLPLWLRSLERPTVAHIFGFRDPLGTAVAAWCRGHGVPYVFEPLGMFMPR